MRRLLLALIVVLGSVCADAQGADPFAESRAVLRKRLSGDLRQMLKAEPKRQFFIRVPTQEGLLHFRLRRVERDQTVRYLRDVSLGNHPWEWTHAVLFKGHYVDRHHSAIKAVSADIIGLTLRFSFFGPYRNRAYSVIQPLAKDGRTIQGEQRTYTRPSTLGLVCGVRQSQELLVGLQEPPFPVVPALRPTRVLEIGVDADYEFYSAFQDKTAAQIEALLNTVDALFRQQLGVALRLKAVHIFTTKDQPYLSSVAYLLLSEFLTYSNRMHQIGRADVYHLFTGKPMRYSNIGLSYVGEVCRGGGDYSYALSQRYLLSVQALITAHELGHNLGAHHPEEVLEEPPPYSLMSGIMRPANNTFSAFSIGEIVGYVNTYGRCLSKEAVP